MNWQEHKLEWSLAMGLALIFGSLFFGFKSMQQRNFEPDEITYEMARPDSFTPNEYDLSGRQVERKVLNPFEKIVQAIKSLVTKDKKAVVAKVDQKAKEVAQNKKKEEDKKKKSLAAATKKPQFSTRVVGNDQRKLKSGFANNYLRNTQGLNPANSNVNAAVDTTSPEPKKDETVRTAEFKTLLESQPSYENMRKLLVAVSASQVSASDFYSIVQMLLDKDDALSHNVGLFGLQSVPSATSFTLVAQNYDKYSERTRAYADQIMMGYNQPQRISMLGQVLQSSNEDVLGHAGTVINKALESINNGVVENISSVRGEQRGSSLPTDAAAYTNLIPIIQEASLKVSDDEIKSTFETILIQIQNMTNS